MARCALHTTHRTGVCLAVEPLGHTPQCHHAALNRAGYGSGIYVLLHRYGTQPDGGAPADACQLLRLYRRTDGAHHRKENAHRAHARRLCGRCVVRLHLHCHRTKTDAARHSVHQPSVGTVHLAALGGGGHLCACATSCTGRLLPTDSPVLSLRKEG